MPGTRAWRIAAVLAAMPVVLVAGAVFYYGLDVPYWDEWVFVPLLGDAAEGTARWEQLWAQHNEHRLVLPRLVMLALAWLAPWNPRVAMGASVLVALGTLFLLAGLARRTLRVVAPGAAPWVTVAAAWLLFTLACWENWTWGWQVQIFINVGLAVGAASAIAHLGAGTRGMAVATLLAVGAVFSFGSGASLTALVPAMALVAPGGGTVAARVVRAAAAGLVLAGVMALYMHGFEYPTHHPPPTVIFTAPLEYWRWVATYLGASFGVASVEDAVPWGVFGLVAVPALALAVLRDGPAQRAAAWPWLFLAGYGLLAGLVTAIGRSGFGAAQALSTRYLTFSALYWIGGAALLGIHVHDRLADARAQGRPAYATVAVVAAVLALAVRGYVGSSVAGVLAMRGHRNVLGTARPCLLAHETAQDDCLRPLFADPRLVRAGAARLARLGLGPFRPGAPGAPPPPPAAE